MIEEARYLHASPGSELPAFPKDGPFACVVIVRADVTRDWRAFVSRWLVDRGCLYMMAWGRDCVLWNDDVDSANLEDFTGRDIPDERFVMTTWHSNEPVEEVFWYASFCALHGSVDLGFVLLLDIAESSTENDTLASFHAARTAPCS